MVMADRSRRRRRRRGCRILVIVLAITPLLLLLSSCLISGSTTLQSHDEHQERRRLLSSPDPTSSTSTSSSSSILKCPEGYTVQTPRRSDEDGGFFFLHQSTYAASFPGGGDKLITKYLVEALTGLRVGDTSSSSSTTTNYNNNVDAITDVDDDCCENNDGQGHVVAVRTSWPHTSSTGLPRWDQDIPRAFVILRNPLRTLPRYFNHLYEMRNHLPRGSAVSAQYAVDSRET